MPEERVNGGNIHYEIGGVGEPLLLIPGLGGDGHGWLPVIEGLSDSFRVVAVDNRGAGRSDVPEEPYTVLDMADDAVQLLDRLAVKRAHVIGHSMGGYIAQELALNYPGRVGKLVLECTAPVSSERNNLLFRCFLEWRRQGMAMDDWMRAWSFWLFTPRRFEERTCIEEFVRECVEYPYPQSTEGFAAQVEALSSFDARARLDKIRADTLVVAGEEDILIPPGESETLTKGIPQSSMLVVDGAAHMLNAEKAEAFNAAVRKFILEG